MALLACLRQVADLLQRRLNVPLESRSILELPADRLAYIPGRCWSLCAQRNSNKGVISGCNVTALLDRGPSDSARVPDEDVINALPRTMHLVAMRALVLYMCDCTCHSLLNHPFDDDLSSLGSHSRRVWTYVGLL